MVKLKELFKRAKRNCMASNVMIDGTNNRYWVESMKKFMMIQEDSIPDNIVVYCRETDTQYQYNSNNDAKDGLGKWRVYVKNDFKLLPSLESLSSIIDLTKNIPIKNSSFGVAKISMKTSYDAFTEQTVRNTKNPVVTLKVQTDIDRRKGLRTVNTKHTIFNIGKDGTLYKIVVESFFKGILTVGDYDMTLVQALTIACAGVFEVNNMNDSFEYAMTIPNITDLSIGTYHNYDGYVETFSNNQDIMDDSTKIVESGKEPDVCSELSFDTLLKNKTTIGEICS